MLPCSLWIVIFLTVSGKAFEPIDVTELGIIIEYSEQLISACVGILVTEFGIIIFRKE